MGLFRSEDGGDSWQEITALKKLPQSVRKNWWYPQAPHHGHVRNIHIHPDDPQTIYLCLEHGGIVRSFDRGATWEDVSKGIDYLDIHVIANFPKRNDRYYVASARGFFTSEKPEVGWTRAENGMTRDYFHDFLFLDPQSDGDQATMLIGAADASPGFWRRENRGARAAIFKSTDGAESWTRVTNGLADELDSMVWASGASSDRSQGGFRRLRQRRPRPRVRLRRRRRSDDQPRHGRQLGAIGYRVAGGSSLVGGGGVANAPLGVKPFKKFKSVRNDMNLREQALSGLNKLN